MNASFRIAGIVAVGLFLLATGSARADMDVTGSYWLTKTKSILEVINITKDVDVSVSKEIAVDAASEQEILKNQTNIDNFVQDETPDADAEIIDSGIGMVGLADDGSPTEICEIYADADKMAFFPRKGSE